MALMFREIDIARRQTPARPRIISNNSHSAIDNSRTQSGKSGYSFGTRELLVIGHSQMLHVAVASSSG